MAKVVMISGGGRGLGAAITRKLLSEKWQVSLGLRDTNQVDAFEAGSDQLLAVPYDATVEGAPDDWVATTVERFGQVDALVNNAGIFRMVGFSNGSTKDMNDLWAINVMGPFLLTRAALPELRKTGAGRIVNIASTDAKRFRPGSSAGYTMSKHSLLAMTQAVRAEGWDDGIRATALCPGAIDTDLIAYLPGATPKADRLAPGTVAEMVNFLLSLPNQASVPELIANTRMEGLL
jgi:NAD(P)-dependent dehydrogenase (short-subunit alcohol dehydrogenase family)|tara:strand:- start:1190 stop:1891 length:702 start_codon:yes stop_codon:yes gene_type:complete